MILRRPLQRRLTPLLRAAYRHRHASTTPRQLTLGIRAEDPKRLWERRCPVTPDAVASLIANHGIDVVVQPCNRRVFADAEWRAAGARVDPSLQDASIIIGIKEVPLDQLLTSPINGRARTQIFFSHTAKGQPYNLPLLASFLAPSPNSISISTSGTSSTSTLPRLIDYELLTDARTNKRTVGFGYFAGAAGVIEALCASALDLLGVGIASPFLYLPRPYAHRDLASARASLRAVGAHIASHGTPAAAGPFVIAVTGSGNVSQGALDMLRELPLQDVKPAQLPGLLADPDADLTKVYVVHATPESYLFRDDGAPYERADYYAHPSTYRSRFYETIAPYTSLLINGAGWRPGFPRLLSNQDLAHALRNARAVGRARFRSIADISCDVEGGLECLTHSTTIDSPFFIARPSTIAPSDPGVQVMAVDILPSEVPYDASIHFCTALMPYLRALIRSESLSTVNNEDGDGGLKLEVEADKVNLDALDRATIARAGRLTARHRWLYTRLADLNTESRLASTSGSDLSSPSAYRGSTSAIESMFAPVESIDSNPPSSSSFPKFTGYSSMLFSPSPSTRDLVSESVLAPVESIDANPPSSASAPAPLSASTSTSTRASTASFARRKRVVLFGSGMVAKPFCQSVWRRSADVQLVIASNNLPEARELVHRSGKEGVTEVVSVDVMDDAKVRALVRSADVVASLLPASLHPRVAKHCLEHRKHLITASYISPEMRDFHERTLQTDVLFLNEIGLDPGIDHLSAMEMRDRFESEGKKIVSFISWCGGLPAPEHSNVPLGMKFSWTPRGLLGAALNAAQFKLNGKEFEIAGADLLASHFPNVPLVKGFALEGLANRDSLPYAETYRLGELDQLSTVFRGTLRYKGFSRLLNSFKKMGLLSTEGADSVTLKKSWTELGAAVLGKKLGHGRQMSMLSLSTDLPSAADQDEAMEALEELSVFPGRLDLSLPPVPLRPHTPLDLLAMLLAHKLRYLPGERDMVILAHEVVTEPLGTATSSTTHNQEVHKSTLIAYGEPNGSSAMARTVGLPLASATLHVLDGDVSIRGVAAPVESEIYSPVLADLRKEGLVLCEGIGMKSMAQELTQDLKTLP